MNTVFGIVCDKDGFAHANGNYWATPANSIRAVQESKIPIDLDHSGVAVGEVVHLERHAGNLWAVGHVHDSVVPEVQVRVADETVTLDHPLYWSASRIGDEEIGFVLTSLALTASPARVAPQPVTFLPGSIGYRSIAKEHWHLRNHELELMTRAANAHLDRRRTSPLEPLVVHGEHPRPAALEVRSAAPIEFRSAAAVEVHRSRREVDMIIAPAESPTVIYERSRSFVEVFAHGCFSGCETNPEKVRVNRDHERSRTIGKALRLDPWDEQGLTGTVRLAKIKDADEALAMIDEELLGVSAGFAIDPGGEEWQGSKARRIRRALLDHIALVPEPAYETAAVLGVRGHQLLAQR